MLQAKTEEQKTYIENVILKDTSTWFDDGVCDGIHIDDWVSFDEMKQIVEYLEHSNDTEYWNRVLNKNNEHNKK